MGMTRVRRPSGPAREPAAKTPDEAQRAAGGGEVMHAQDYPRDRPAFERSKGTFNKRGAGAFRNKT